MISCGFETSNVVVNLFLLSTLRWSPYQGIVPLFQVELAKPISFFRSGCIWPDMHYSRVSPCVFRLEK